MNILYYIIGFTVWWCIGYKSFVYYWTYDRDLTISDERTGYFLGLFGPVITISCIIVRLIEGTRNDDKIVKKTRT